MDKKLLEDRIVELRQKREEFLRNAEQQVAAFNGAIAELERLLQLVAAGSER